MLLHFVCVCMQASAGLFVFDTVCLLLVALSVKFSGRSGEGGGDGVLAQQTIPWRFDFATMMHLYEEKFSRRCAQACGCTQYYVCCVFCFCFFRQKSGIVFLWALYRKEFTEFIARSKVSWFVMDDGMVSWKFLLQGVRCCWLCACVKGLRVVANEESELFCAKSANHGVV